MRLIYSWLFYCSLPALLLRLWWKGRKIPAYRLRWQERLGFIPAVSAKNSLWIHAVSLGEMVAARPLILALRAQSPERMLVITTTTVTGSSLAQQYVGAKVYHCYLPYDMPGPVKRFLDRVCPTQAIIMETELWPNLLHYMGKRNIPVLLANARLSQASMQSYLAILWLTRQMLQHIACIAAQTQQDAERFSKLGAKASQLQVLGNIKFDLPIPKDLIEAGQALRHSWGAARPSVIAASTHAGEEQLILSAFNQLLQHYPTALLILVPRHPERFDEVAQLCQKQGFNSIRRSQQQACLPDTNLFVGDSLGELFLYYALADVAFVGGSLVKVGGHNPLEPAALGLAVISGPYTFNFNEIFTLLHRADAALSVLDSTELYQAWLRLLDNPEQRQQMGQAGQKVVEQNRGAVARHLAHLTPPLPKAAGGLPYLNH